MDIKLKILDKYIIKSYFSRLIGVFAICFIIFIIQTFWLYVDELAGKGLDIFTIGKFFVYFSPKLVPLVLPLSILLASLMTYGTLSENSEFIAMKSNGISIIRTMVALLVFHVFLGIGAFYFSNHVVTYGELKSYNLRKNLAKLKPTLAIREGIFNDIGDMNIKVNRKYGDNEQYLEDIILHKINLNDEKLFPFFEAASELEASIFIHPWDMLGTEEINKYWLPWLVGMPAETSRAICSLIFGGVFERLPNLKIAFAHGGGSFSATIGRIQHGFNVRPDLCAVDNKIAPESYLGKFWVDSLVHDPHAMNLLIDKLGKDKIMLGTDYPFPLGDLEPGKIIESSDYSKETKEMILSKNSLDWLGLPHNFYEI